DKLVTGVQTCALPISEAAQARVAGPGCHPVDVGLPGGRLPRHPERAGASMIEYHPMSPEAKEDPERFFSVLRRECPVHHYVLGRSEERRVGKGWRVWG